MLKYGTCACLLAALALAPGCRKQPERATSRATAPVVPSELTANRLQGAPAGLLSSRASSPVHWQHWDPAVLQQAASARRLIFAVIGSAQYPGCIEALDTIDKDPALVAKLNSEFVPVLVDMDLSREAAIAAGVMSQELRQPVSFPFILVLSPDGNEVTWRPISYAPGVNLLNMFEGSTDVIARMWKESPDYVRGNSKKDHENRIQRLPAADSSPASTEERDAILARTIRKLVSLYDEDINTISGTGGLLPLGMLQCLASAAMDPKTPPDIAKRCREAASAFGHSVLNSAMIDPLDGGAFSSRQGRNWDLPMINRTCTTQARAARALVTLYNATKDPRALEVALGVVRFAEEQYSAQNGLFATQRLPGTATMASWLWTQEQVEHALSQDEAALWKQLCGIKGMGNLPLEADPMREYFRMNSLAIRTPLEEVAKSRGLTLEAANELLESGRKKLLKARQDRVPDRPAASSGSAAASFRMVSAYAALFTGTGDTKWRDKAIALAGTARQAFTNGTTLVEQSSGQPDNVTDARAFTYALAIQASLDLAEVTMDENWRLWAGDLCSTMSELFVDEKGRMVEARPLSTMLTLPLEDRIMLFDDSTAGLMRMNIARLQALGQPPPPALAPWLTSLPKIEEFPVVFTDSILSTSFARSRVIVELPEKASPEWQEAACKLPLDRVARRFGKGNTAKLVAPDGTETPISTPEAMAQTISTEAH